MIMWRSTKMRQVLFKIIAFVIILALFLIPAYFLSDVSHRTITGNTALSPMIDHYDVYCSEEPFTDIEGMEIVDRLNTTTKVPPKCLRMPSAYVAYVPVDKEGKQVGIIDYQLH